MERTRHRVRIKYIYQIREDTKLIKPFNQNASNEHQNNEDKL